MALPEQLTAQTYRALWQRLVEAALAGRPTVQTPEGPAPALTNAEAVRILHGWRYATARTSKKWRGWYALVLPALGYYKPGDKFRTDAEHKPRPYDPASMSRLWSETQALAGQLDEAGARVGPLYLSSSADTYRQMALIAWEVLKAILAGGDTASAIDEADGGTSSSPIGPIPRPPKPVPLPELPDPDKVPKPPLPLPGSSGGGGGLLLLGLAALVAFGAKKRRRS